jgi:hypothetical protein
VLWTGDCQSKDSVVPGGLGDTHTFGDCNPERLQSCRSYLARIEGPEGGCGLKRLVKDTECEWDLDLALI